MNGPVTQAEFRRVIDAKALAEEGETFRYEASDAERAAIASWLSLISLRRLEAKVDAKPVTQGGVRLSVAFTADLVQSCVTTLEPLSTCLQEAFELLYLPEIPRQNPAAAGGITVDVDLDEDQPEVLIDGKIDAGAAITEHLVLALDPYPRKPGAELESVSPATNKGRDNPFSVLQGLKAADESGVGRWTPGTTVAARSKMEDG